MSARNGRQVRYKLPKLWRFLIAWLIFLLFLNYDPTGMSHAGESWLVRVVNYLGAPLYESEAQNEIVIVMADRTSLEEIGWTWPLRFDQQAEVIGRIVAQGPRVLALDLLFLDNRPGQGLEFLQDTLAQPISQDGKEVPVIGAAPPENIDIVRPELQFSKEADITVDTDWPDMGYRLVGDRHGRPLERPSLAFTVYREICTDTEPPRPLCPNRGPIDTRAYEREMLVFWGSGLPDYVTLFQGNEPLARRLFDCREDSRSTWERIIGMVLLQRHTPESTCAYHAVLPLDLIMHLGSNELKPMLEDKIVLYGLHHPGIPDIVTPPTSQPIAGVHLHAMALDNLLTYGPDYFGATSRDLWGVRSLSLATLRLIIAGFVFATIFSLLLSSRDGKKDKSARLGKKMPINDFDDAKDATSQLLKRIGPAGIYRDVAEGLAGWNRRRDKHLRAAGKGPSTWAVWLYWLLGLLPALLHRTATGRCALFLWVFALIVYLDLYVLMVPPINALTLVAILGASQLIVPARIFRPRPRRRRKPKDSRATAS